MTRGGCHPELVSGSNFRYNILYNNQNSQHRQKIIMKLLLNKFMV